MFTRSRFPVVCNAIDDVGVVVSLTIMVVVFIFVRCLMNVPGTLLFSLVLVRTRTLVTFVRSRSDRVMLFIRFVAAVMLRRGLTPAIASLKSL